MEMNRTVQNEKESARLCHACSGQVFGNDRFCRTCGVRQTEQVAGSFAGINNSVSLAVTKGVSSPPAYVTARLGPKGGYQSFSGSLVKLITESVTATNTARLKSRWSKRLALAVISIPIWLLIVLLSPFDAYVAAKMAVERN
jgi:hypothetical protein